MYLYLTIKCYTKLADVKQFLDNEFMNFHINLFKDMNLDKNILKDMYTIFWGKIFYLIAEYIILSSGDKQDVIYFYEISKKILIKLGLEDYLKSKKRF